jgi:plasmid stability protein
VPSVTIKKIPERLYRSLKQRARAHHRSINGEAIACLERTLGVTRLAPQGVLARIDEMREQLRVPKLTDRILREAKNRGRA